MLRVLTLSTLFPDASRPNFGNFVERQTLGLAARDGVALKICAPIGIAPWPLSRAAPYARFADVPLREEWKGLNVLRPRFTHWPKTSGRFDAGSLARALLPLLRELRQSFAFDVIDAEFFFPDGPAAVALGEALGVPVSIKARGSDIHYWGMQPATAAQVIAAGQRADGVLAVSEAIRADMIALGMPAEKVCTHYTGVDQERFQPRDRATAKASLGVTGPLIVSAGTMSVRKGHDVLINALPGIPGATLVLIGQGPDRAAFEAQAAALGLGARVRFTGAIPHDQIPLWLGAADVFSLASQAEGLANVWVEALACGTPIVITGAGGAREVVDRPEAGQIVSADPQAFAAAITDLIAAPPPQAAVRAAAARFSWTTNSDALFAHLAGLVSAYIPR